MRAKVTRDQIVEVADRLFYEQGFSHTSFADIASEVGISRGNFYHHFKTKDLILGAVIERRLLATRAMLHQWEEHASDPLARVNCFIRILITNWTQIRAFGCPVGTLTSELAKLNHPALPKASEVFSLFRDWLETQFIALGQKSRADDLAMQVLSFSQGVATLGAAFKDEKYIKKEVSAMENWLAQIVGNGGE